MKLFWFYNSGLVPECWTSTLEIDNDRLFGRHGNQCTELLPADIIEVKEFSGNNPFLLITTAEDRFHVGAMTKQYDQVECVLRRYIGSDFCWTFAHRWNVFFYQKQFGLISFFKSRFSRRNDAVSRLP